MNNRDTKLKRTKHNHFPLLTSYFLLNKNKNAQTAIEYMLLLGVVVALVLIGFKVSLPQTRASANIFFNRAAIGIMGKPNPCGDCLCDPDFEDFEKCPVDCSGDPCP